MNVFDTIVASGPRLDIRFDFAKGIRPGLGFPPSYIELVTRFGYGFLCDRFLVYPPLEDYADSFYVQSPGIKWALDETLQLDDPGYDFLLEPDGSRELIPHLVGFSTGENGESLFWDVRSGGRDEYPVYISGRGMGIRYAGDDLRDFVRRVTDPATVRSVMKFTDEAMPPAFRCAANATFEAWLRSRGQGQ